MIQELDIVVLNRSLPEHGLEAGDIGTVVLVHREGTGFEVEFATLTGETVAVVTVPANAIRPVGEREIAHVRAVA
jgi:ribulose-5-phosphate 4-epimerase/fuculose-1-phosphate aldolase